MKDDFIRHEDVNQSYVVHSARQQISVNHDIDQRLKLLEEKVFKKAKRLRATEAQRFLIDYHLGLIAPIQQLPTSQNQKDILVSIRYDIDPDNARKFLAQTNSKNKPLLHTISNYTFLVNFFEQVG